MNEMTYEEICAHDDAFRAECRMNRDVTATDVLREVTAVLPCLRLGDSRTEYVLEARRFPFHKFTKAHQKRLWLISWSEQGYARQTGPFWALDADGLLYVRLFFGRWRACQIEAVIENEPMRFPLASLQKLGK